MFDPKKIWSTKCCSKNVVPKKYCQKKNLFQKNLGQNIFKKMLSKKICLMATECNANACVKKWGGRIFPTMSYDFLKNALGFQCQ